MVGIYFIKNKESGKLYIGSALNVKIRWSGHISALKKQKHHSKYLQRAWNKYGEKNFEFIIIEQVYDKNNLLKLEQLYLDKFKTYERKNGYNICKIAGNTLGFKHTEKSKSKMSQQRKNTLLLSKRKPVLQYDLSGNFIREWDSQTTASNDLKIHNITKCCNDKIDSSGGFIWKFKINNDFPKTLNYNEIPTREKSIVQLDLNLNKIKEWKSANEIEQTIKGTSAKAIRKVCYGASKTSFGFIWIYKEKYIQES